MELRAPAYPLITIDPYLSVWAMADKLTDSETKHWTGKPNTIKGAVIIDGTEYRFMGESDGHPIIEQISCDVDMFSTTYKFTNGTIEFTAKFTSPVDVTDFDRMSRPVSYLKTDYKSLDGKDHEVRVQICVSEELCLNEKGQSPVVAEEVIIDGLKVMKMGNSEQKPLHKSGDDIRIDWGYVYLAVRCDNGVVKSCECPNMGNSISATGDCGSLFVFAYDDIYSIEYFGDKLTAYWKRDGITIEEVIKQDVANYASIMERVNSFADQMFIDAVRAGGEKYAELLELAYRQVIAAHKLVLDTDGNVLYISKECFSNGCAATVDVSYPSIPMFLLYNTELVKGMMRPIFKYAASDVWPFDFAPHDAGQYPLLNGQVYSGGVDPKNQMPVEECGNMLVMATAVSVAENDCSFAEENLELLKKWADYLVANGVDPENQLCTDDFAGHLAHNCNLSIKAIMGVAGYSIIKCMMNGGNHDSGDSKVYMEKAYEMAQTWSQTAANGDGSYRLAFDRPDTYSMKYNAVWDKLFGTNLFPKELIQSEVSTNFRRMNCYGMPLDNRARYTKSDWLVWTATLLNTKEDFIRYITPLWNAYNSSTSRVPMTDWYDTVTGIMVGFQHRTVQGGLFIKLLEYKWRDTK